MRYSFNIFISGGIIEIFVLVEVIVRSLFKDNLTEALKIIIASNNQSKVYKNNKKYNNFQNLIKIKKIEVIDINFNLFM